jgi:TRAP-type C4-dicarboxylate transport system substrate-binding protein
MASSTVRTADSVRLAGYQGEASILTAALRQLAQALQVSDWELPVEFEADVTAQGEKAAELFASLEQGTRQIGYMASSYLSGRVPALGVLDLPFSVSDRAAALAALDGRAGAMLREAVARDSGFHVLAFWDNGFRHISNAVRPIRTPADCAGLVIRTLDNADYRAMLETLGFTPVTTDVKELVHAVETGAVQAQENPLTNLISFGLWRHHRHVSLTGHFFGVLLLVCPRDWYRGLGPSQRTVLDRAVERATATQRQQAASQDAAALEALRTRSIEVLGPQQVDLAAMRAAVEPLAARQRATLPAELLAAYLGGALH